MKKSSSYAAAASVLGCAVCSSAFSTYHRGLGLDTRAVGPAQKDSSHLSLSRLHRRLPRAKKRGRSEGPLPTSASAETAAAEGSNSADDYVDQPNKPSAAGSAGAAGAVAASAAGSPPLNAVADEEQESSSSQFGELDDKGGVSKDRLAFEELGTREMDRLFSTLEPCDVTGFRRKTANVLTAASLIGGTAVGAGILALPAATLQAGLLPSSVGLLMM